MTTELREAPIAAMKFSAGPVQFTAREGSANAKLDMIARSGKPIDHWYWGRIVHDMAGMEPSKSRIPVDYVHGEECGYLDEFKVDKEYNLRVSGELVPTSASDDIARKIIERQAGGVPYEASIFFDPYEMLLEEVGEGFSAQVNGEQFEGPGLIVRKWKLRGVAVCPYGQDRNTESEVQALGHFQCPINKIGPPVDNTTSMSTTQPKTPPKSEGGAGDQPNELSKNGDDPNANSSESTAGKQAAELSDKGKSEVDPPAPAADSSVDQLSAGRDELSRFMEAFGDEQGAVWFRQGLSFEAAQVEFTKSLREENTELKQKLSGATAADEEGAGENAPAGFSGGSGGAKKSLAEFCQTSTRS
ncbi:MAG: hypothetical protein AAGF31_03305 [Planctomycetota bacterium]